MDKDSLNSVWRKVWYVVSFVAVVAVSYALMPRESRFERFFEVGKPWGYDLLMSPMDFAIYKTDAQLQQERDSALTELVPYFNLNSEIGRRQIEAFDNSRAGIDDDRNSFIRRCIAEVYDRGVLSSDQMQSMKEMGISGVELVNTDNVVKGVGLDDMFTPKTAYEYVMASADKRADITEEWLKTENIERFIKSNVTLDKKKTEHAKQEIIDGVLLTSGMVQEGERIIDRGEVVSPATYQILKSLKIAKDGEFTQNSKDVWTILGDVMLIVILYLLLFAYFYQFRTRVLQSLKMVWFMLLMSVGMIAILSLVLHFTDFSEYLVPFAMLPIVVRVFFDSRTALYIHIITVLIAAQMVSNPMEFILLQILAGMVAVSSLKDMNSRGQLVRAAGLIFLVYVLSFTAVELSQGVKFSEFDWWMYLVFFINVVTLMFAYVLIFVVEKVFGFLSDVTLVELSNINNPILMEFSEKCPGTFQHVLQVSNLSVEVAKKVDANALLVRTGALYHDLGKMENPMSFTENQMAGINPLNELSFEEAAQVIISHVTEGVRMARKAGLPEQIVDFIMMHHGTSKVRYFYNSFKNKYPDREIDESLFTYPGPLPATKETAILMMTDAVEAASRSLKAYSDEAIDKMVEGVINGQIADGQFKNAPLSFRDVETAKSVFKEKLKNIYHTRISYPELKKREETTAQAYKTKMPHIFIKK